jgi:hypothetical protein
LSSVKILNFQKVDLTACLPSGDSVSDSQHDAGGRTSGAANDERLVSQRRRRFVLDLKIETKLKLDQDEQYLGNCRIGKSQHFKFQKDFIPNKSNQFLDFD